MKTSNTGNTTENKSGSHSALPWMDQKIRRFIKILNVKLGHFSMTWQVVIMLFTVVLLAAANASVLWTSLHSERQVKLSVQPIPFSSLKADHPDSVLTQEEYTKLVLFNRMLDSLLNDPQSQGIYNELMRMHPGIRDSINYLLKYYPPSK